MVLTYPSPVPRLGLALLALIALLVLSAGCGAHQDAAQRTASGRKSQARDLARRAGLSIEVQDFLARYAAASGNSFEVTYAPSSSGTTVAVAQDPPLKRVDLVTPPMTQSVFVTADGTFNCALENQKWECQKAAQQESPPGLLSPADIQREVQQLQAAKPDYTFRVSNRKLAGTSARCLTVTPKPHAATTGARSELCLSNEGAVLLFDGTSVQSPLKAVRYTTNVDTRRFRLPATPGPVLPSP
jgi:hypothetical protein